MKLEFILALAAGIITAVVIFARSGERRIVKLGRIRAMETPAKAEAAINA